MAHAGPRWGRRKAVGSRPLSRSPLAPSARPDLAPRAHSSRSDTPAHRRGTRCSPPPSRSQPATSLGCAQGPRSTLPRLPRKLPKLPHASRMCIPAPRHLFVPSSRHRALPSATRPTAPAPHPAAPAPRTPRRAHLAPRSPPRPHALAGACGCQGRHGGAGAVSSRHPLPHPRLPLTCARGAPPAARMQGVERCQYVARLAWALAVVALSLEEVLRTPAATTAGPWPPETVPRPPQ